MGQVYVSASKRARAYIRNSKGISKSVPVFVRKMIAQDKIVKELRKVYSGSARAATLRSRLTKINRVHRGWS